jgi:hypothetical protein
MLILPEESLERGSIPGQEPCDQTLVFRMRSHPIGCHGLLIHHDTSISAMKCISQDKKPEQ